MFTDRVFRLCLEMTMNDRLSDRSDTNRRKSSPLTCQQIQNHKALALQRFQRMDLNSAENWKNACHKAWCRQCSTVSIVTRPLSLMAKP